MKALQNEVTLFCFIYYIQTPALEHKNIYGYNNGKLSLKQKQYIISVRMLVRNTFCEEHDKSSTGVKLWNIDIAVNLSGHTVNSSAYKRKQISFS